MPEYRIVVTDHVFPSREVEQSMLGVELGAELVFCSDAGESALVDAMRDADAVMVTYARINETVISAMRRCRIIARYGVGTDNIDVAAASHRRIPVTNVPDYCVHEVSDHALALMLALARKVVFLDRLVQAGDWGFAGQTPIPRLSGKTLGLLAYGRIARAVAHKARAFGMRALAYDPYAPPDPEAGVSFVSLDRLLAESDFLSVHSPLTPATHHLIGATELARMKATACIINTARGGIIDEAALAEALNAGIIAGAALDVLETEPIQRDNPLLRARNCILTPHAAFYSEESTVELQAKASLQVIKALCGQPLDYCINPETAG